MKKSELRAIIREVILNEGTFKSFVGTRKQVDRFFDLCTDEGVDVDEDDYDKSTKTVTIEYYNSKHASLIQKFAKKAGLE